MRAELTHKLYDEFPSLFMINFPEGYEPKANHRYVHFECMDGWFDIIYELCKELSELYPDLKATQVKEKFGGLRFYTDGSNKEIHSLVCKAESESFKTCEMCGIKENVKLTGSGWVKTLCPACKIIWDNRYEDPFANI